MQEAYNDEHGITPTDDRAQRSWTQPGRGTTDYYDVPCIKSGVGRKPGSEIDVGERLRARRTETSGAVETSSSSSRQARRDPDQTLEHTSGESADGANGMFDPYAEKKLVRANGRETQACPRGGRALSDAEQVEAGARTRRR